MGVLVEVRESQLCLRAELDGQVCEGCMPAESVEYTMKVVTVDMMPISELLRKYGGSFMQRGPLPSTTFERRG